MASDERNLRKLTNKELNALRQEAIAEEIRRIEEDPNAFVVPTTASRGRHKNTRHNPY